MKITPIVFSLLSILGFSLISQASPVDQTIFESDYFEGRVNGDVKQDNLLASLRYKLNIEDDLKLWIPRVEVSLNGKLVGVINGTGSPFAAGLVQIAQMDKSNLYPEIIFSSFTGGAHCCNEVIVMTSDKDKWFIVELDYFDGGSHEAKDIDNDGVYEYVNRDNRFLYRFSSYADSWAPSQIWQLKGSKFVDVTHEERFKFVHKNNLNEMDTRLSDYLNDPDINGFLAAYVANKALIGEFEEGWNFMLEKYYKDSEWSWDECLEYDNERNCLVEVKYKSYPDALRDFLARNGYLKK
jgi:hypothetical protein